MNEPFVSPDGRYLYYSEDMYPGGFFQYNKDPNDQIYVIKRYDMETGKTITVTGGPGGAARPTVSRDGKKLAYIRRVRTKSVLYIHDLETGQDRPLYDGLSKDQQEAWAIFGVYPNFNWTPDDSHIIIWSEGKLHRIAVSDGTVTNIPFTADVAIDIAESLHVEHPVETHFLQPQGDPASCYRTYGNTMVFHAVGYLWKKTMPNGTPTRLTNSTDFEYEPAFSPDGSKIIYVSWNDQERGKIMQVSAQGGSPTALTTEKATYRTPSFSPDGNWIAYRTERGNMDQGFSFATKPGIYLMPAAGGDSKFLTETGEYPRFTADGNRLFLKTGGTYFGNLTKKLISVNLDGKDLREHISSKYANWLVPSPDNKWIAFSNLHKVYVAPLTLTGKAVSLDDKSKSVPVSQLAGDAGIGIHWSADSQKVMWTLGDQFYSSALKDRFTFLPGSPEKVDKPSNAGSPIG